MTRVTTWIFVACALMLCSTVHGNAGNPTIELKVIVNSDDSSEIGDRELESYFLMTVRHLRDGTPVIPLNDALKSEQRESFDRAVLGLTPDEVARYWLDQRIRSGGSSPRQVEDPSLRVRLVARLKGAVSYVPASADTKSVRVVARIRDHKLVPR